MHRNWASHFCLSFKNFIFPRKIVFLVLGGGVGGLALGLALGRRVPADPPLVDKHIPLYKQVDIASQLLVRVREIRVLYFFWHTSF